MRSLMFGLGGGAGNEVLTVYEAGFRGTAISYGFV